MGFPKAGVRMSILKASYYPKCIEWFYWEGSLGGADAKVFGIWFPISFGTCSASFCFTRSSEACSIRLSNRADVLQGNDSLWWTAVPTKTRQFQGLHPYVQGDNKIQSWQWNTMNNWDFKHLHKHQPFHMSPCLQASDPYYAKIPSLFQGWKCSLFLSITLAASNDRSSQYQANHETEEGQSLEKAGVIKCKVKSSQNSMCSML